MRPTSNPNLLGIWFFPKPSNLMPWSMRFIYCLLLLLIEPRGLHTRTGQWQSICYLCRAAHQRHGEGGDWPLKHKKQQLGSVRWDVACCRLWLVLWSTRLRWHLEGVCEELRQHGADAVGFACNGHLHTHRGVRRTWENPQILQWRLSALNTVKQAIGLTTAFIAVECQIMTIAMHLWVRKQDPLGIYPQKKPGIVAAKQGEPALPLDYQNSNLLRLSKTGVIHNSVFPCAEF